MFYKQNVFSLEVLYTTHFEQHFYGIKTMMVGTLVDT